MTQYLLMALAGLLALSGGLGWLSWQQRATIGAVRAEQTALQDALEGAQEARKRDQATLVARERQRAVTDRSEALQRASVDAAVSNNKDWASQPVPQEVQDALRSDTTAASPPVRVL